MFMLALVITIIIVDTLIRPHGTVVYIFIYLLKFPLKCLCFFYHIHFHRKNTKYN
jgi:hypothetical protein